MIKAMRFGITWKILSAVFITALVVVCGMLFLVQWSFDRGFLEYVNRIEQETQQNFIATLAKEYETYGNWEFATDDHRYWRELYLRSFLQLGVDISRSGSNDTVHQHMRGRRGRLAGELFKSRMALLDENGSLKVELAADKERISIVMEDSAPGVGAEDLPRLFDRLFRVESSRNRSGGGTGLGLAICKNIVAAHDGSISATLSALGGVKILIELPRSAYHGKN